MFVFAERDPSSADLLELEEPEGAEPLPVEGLLPAALDGWTIQGPQVVPGSAGSKVEAYFNPRSEALSLVTPMMAYVRVTKMPSAADALAEPAVRADSQYPMGRGQTVIGGVTVETGHTEDIRIYYLGWSVGDRVYTVEATYTHVVPTVRAQAIDILKGAAEEVAGSIIGETGTGGDL